MRFDDLGLDLENVQHGTILQDCLCGLTGPNCTKLQDPLADASLVMSQFCDIDGFASCAVGSDKVFCDCRCGWEGDLCGDRVVPTGYNFALGLTLAVLFVAFFSLMAWRLCVVSKRLRRSTNGAQRIDFVTSTFPRIIPRRLIMTYRILNVLLFIAIFIWWILKSGKRLLATFTLWTWVLFGIFFTLGSYLSIRDEIYRHGNRMDGNRMMLKKPGPAEVAYAILLGILGPASIFIAVVVWSVLLPAALQMLNGEAVLNGPSYVGHATNVILLLIEFLLGSTSSVVFMCADVVYLLDYISIYYIFHVFYMLMLFAANRDHCPMYPFLGMENKFFILISIGILLFTLPFYFIWWMVSKFKEKCLPKHKDVMSKEMQSKRDNPVNIEANENQQVLES